MKRVKLIPDLNQDGIDKNDYRGALGEIDVSDAEAKHLYEAGRCKAGKLSKKPKKKA